MTSEPVALWLASHPLTAIQVDCVITVMLKIMDGKCKMKSEDKIVMTRLYEQLHGRPGELLGNDIHQLIRAACGNLDEAMKNIIYEKRLLAETMISRPVMKGFKAMIREQGLFEAALGEPAS